MSWRSGSGLSAPRERAALNPAGSGCVSLVFQHNLFRTYLYNELSDAERVLFHEDVGAALEELYGQQVDKIAVQLAHQYVQAGIRDRARHYLQLAGERRHPVSPTMKRCAT